MHTSNINTSSVFSEQLNIMLGALVSTIVVLVLRAEVSVADIPVECYFSDVKGTWTFYESARDGKPGLACDDVGE